MIRVIGDRVMITKGDTGVFAIPNIYSMQENDIATLVVYDKLYKTIVINKICDAEEDLLVFSFVPEDTKTLEPRTYYWDIIVYHEPIYDDEGNPISGTHVDSYYGTRLKLPRFIIKGGI